MSAPNICVTQALGENQAKEVCLTDHSWYGRRRAIDLRDHNFLLPSPRTLPKKQRKTWRTHPALDQGPTPRCVAFAGLGFLLAAPVRNQKQIKTKEEVETFCNWLYKGAQENDEWPGEDYEGTSDRGSMKVLQQNGFILDFNWAIDTNAITNHLLTKGPLCTGTYWMDTMGDTQLWKKDQFVMVEKGSIDGGHEWLLKGVDLAKKCPDGSKGAYIALNSWGEDWGDKGHFWISIREYEMLLHNDGDAVTANEILKAA